MFNALNTAMSKVPGCRLIALGTRPERDDHWFSKLLDGGADYSLEYKSEARKTWWSMKSIRKANPAYDYLPSLREDLLHAREKARADDEERQSFIAYRLNQGVPETLDTLENLIDLPVFQDIEAPEVEIGPDYVAGPGPVQIVGDDGGRGGGAGRGNVRAASGGRLRGVAGEGPARRTIKGRGGRLPAFRG